jgi:hypothetical protein
MTFEEATKKHSEGTLDWWMTLDGPPTAEERRERARLIKLIVRTWDEARQFPAPVEISPTQIGFPSNQVCGNLVDAAAAILSVSQDRALRMLDTFALYKDHHEGQWIDERLEQYFFHEWTR